jgi:two-component system sensor histidine kinase YesM
LILKLIEEENKKMNALREKELARFYALQVQINPHFVYNALNSVSCISMINGQEHVADALTNLAKIMRYSCRNPEDLVFVSEETEIIRVYEKLQKFCYWQTIDFSYDIEPDTEKYQIPKLIIQPLVENALIYGIESASNKVSVKLTIKKNGEYLLISVWDSGVNANLINLNRIAGGFAKEKRESLGIDNVQERLYVVYGEKASLVYSKDINGNTIASIHIPIDKINT